jgi:hypothetical protein
MLACVHPSIEQRYEEAVQLIATSQRCGCASSPERQRTAQRSSFVRTGALRKYAGSTSAAPVRSHEEVTDVVGLCLSDVFSVNHHVIAADGRVVDIGSFRGAGRAPRRRVSTTTARLWQTLNGLAISSIGTSRPLGRISSIGVEFHLRRDLARLVYVAFVIDRQATPASRTTRSVRAPPPTTRSAQRPRVNRHTAMRDEDERADLPVEKAGLVVRS